MGSDTSSAYVCQHLHHRHNRAARRRIPKRPPRRFQCHGHPGGPFLVLWCRCHHNPYRPPRSRHRSDVVAAAASVVAWYPQKESCAPTQLGPRIFRRPRGRSDHSQAPSLDRVLLPAPTASRSMDSNPWLRVENSPRPTPSTPRLLSGTPPREGEEASEEEEGADPLGRM